MAGSRRRTRQSPVGVKATRQIRTKRGGNQAKGSIRQDQGSGNYSQASRRGISFRPEPEPRNPVPSKKSLGLTESPLRPPISKCEFSADEHGQFPAGDRVSPKIFDPVGGPIFLKWQALLAPITQPKRVHLIFDAIKTIANSGRERYI